MNGTAKILLLSLAALALPGLDALAKTKRDADRAPRPPQFSPAAGVFTNDVTVQIATDVPRAIIRFTLDGTEPTATSAVYKAALTLTNCSLIRARVFVPDSPPGDIGSHNYFLLDPALADFNSNLPLLILNTWDQEILLEAKASEQSSRMVAMKNATDNAKQLIKDLTLEYNKLRQANITKELLEITTAQMALG